MYKSTLFMLICITVFLFIDYIISFWYYLIQGVIHMSKKAYFYIDDTIWALRDITRLRPQSMFDTPFFNMLKTAHEKYGTKVQLNLFYKTSYFYGNDDFCLADVTDAYKSEWEANSDWLKMAFHAKEEFPDYPHINTKYEDMKSQFKAVENEVIRFAGEKSLTYAICPHWNAVSKEGVRALHDCGVKLLVATRGYTFEFEEYQNLVSPGIHGRIFFNRQPETRLRSDSPTPEKPYLSLCAYNHVSLEQYDKIHGTLDYLKDEETGMCFKSYASLCLNRLLFENVEKVINNSLGNEFIGVGNHEQYFYSDYFNYQPDYAEKIYKMSEILSQNGYEFLFIEDLVK